MQVQNGAISRWSTTTLATICGVRDWRHNEKHYVEELIAAAHALSACFDGEERGSEADDEDEFVQVQKEK